MSTHSYRHRIHAAQEPNSPLFFVFHGTGGDENQFFDFAHRLIPSAGIVSPRGDVSEHGAARFFRRTAEGVYDMPDLAVRTGAMADFIRVQKNVANPSKTIGLGYSNGANILASVMLAEPDLVGCAILMHPLIPWAPAPQPKLAGKRVLITAGQRDPICPPDRTQALADYLAAQGTDVTIAWHPGGHEIQQSEIGAIQEFLAR